MSVAARIPDNEEERIATLRSLGVLDSPPTRRLDLITAAAAKALGAPIAKISLVDRDRQWFKSTYGLSARETPREYAFCAHAILSAGVFYVEDAAKDPRFCDNPLVTGPPFLRTYAGAPIVVEGSRIGALCAIFTTPTPLADAQLRMLEALASVVAAEIESRVYVPL